MSLFSWRKSCPRTTKSEATWWRSTPPVDVEERQTLNHVRLRWTSFHSGFHFLTSCRCSQRDFILKHRTFWPQNLPSLLLTRIWVTRKAGSCATSLGIPTILLQRFSSQLLESSSTEFMCRIYINMVRQPPLCESPVVLAKNASCSPPRTVCFSRWCW